MQASTFTPRFVVAAPAVRRRAPLRSVTVASAPKIKVNTFQGSWTKEFFATGLFLEDKEEKNGNYLKKIEEKGLLSFVEKAGLLKTAEKAGLSLKKVEDLKLLSTAESIGALSLLESAAQTDGATISSLSIPFFVITIAALTAIPDDNLVLVLAQNTVAAISAALFAALFAGGFLVNALNE